MKIKDILKNKNLILISLTLFAFLIRLLNIDKDTGLWFDEMNTYILSSKNFPFGILKTLLKNDLHMPLYYLYLGLWAKLFGNTDVILRLASVLWGILTVPALFYLGKTYKSEKLGYLAASIGCISPILIYYSQEVRFYSLLVFLSTLSLTLFLKVLTNPKRKYLILFHLFNLLILYTYTLGIIFVLLELCLLVFHFYFYNKNHFKLFSKSLPLFLILAIPYFSMLLLYIHASNNLILNYFSWSISYNKFPLLFINSWFNPTFFDVYNNDLTIYKHLFATPLKVIFIMLMSLPAFCFITGLFVSLKEKSRQQMYLLIIGLAFILMEILWWRFGTFVVMVKYTLICYPIFLIICLDGLIFIKNIRMKHFLLSIIFSIYIYNIISYKNMMSFESRTFGLLPPAKSLMRIYQKGDYLLSINGSSLYKKYLTGYNLIDFEGYRMFYMDSTRQEILKAFSKNFIHNVNKYNSSEKFTPYLLDTEPTDELKTFINSEIKLIPERKRLIFIEGPFTGIAEDYNYIHNQVTENQNYEDNLFQLVIDKTDLDIKNILKNNTALIRTAKIKLELNPDFCYYIYIYKKTKD